MSISSKGLDLKKQNFATITHEEELENDKQRILKKFNFLSNSRKQLITNNESLENNSNEQINQSEVYYSNENKKGKKNSGSEFNTINSILNFNYKYNTAQKSTMANSIQASKQYLLEKNNTINSTIQNNKKAIVNKTKQLNEINAETITLNKEKEIGNIKINPNQNFDTIYSKKEDKGDEMIDSDSNTKKESSRELNFKTKNILSGDFDIGKDSDSISDIQQNESFHNNKSENNEYENDNNVNLISPFQKENNNKKYLKFFIKNPSYIISNRLINDDLNKFHITNQNQNYKFISKIREENQQIKQLNIKSFLKLKDYPLYNLLSYCYEIYNTLISHTNKFISTKINLVFNNLFEKPINSFSKIYKQHFEIINFYFIEKNFKKSKKNISLINLVMQCKIITNELNKSIEFGYNYTVNKKQYNNLWIIDIKNKKNISLWISSELDLLSNHSKRFCYTSPISTFSKGDFFQLDIVIYSKNGPIEPNSIEWTKPIISNTSEGIFIKKPVGNSYPYDPLRACEIENMIHLWRSEYEIKNISLINEFKKIFGKKFYIKYICFDISKFYFYKIQMIAYNIGKINKNIFTNFEIEVVPYDCELFNEIQSIGLLNTFYLSSFKIRIGTDVTFYLTDVK